MSDPPIWPRVKKIFQAALDRVEEERQDFVREACGDDGMVRADVESLLRAHEQAGGFAERPAALHESDVSRTPPSADFRAGEMLGAYRIVEFIAAGGMGEVYRAHDTKLGRDVAVKILPPAFTADPDRLARFEREARMLAAVNHPNIATIHGVEDTDGVHALVMELVEGPTLAERLA